MTNTIDKDKLREAIAIFNSVEGEHLKYIISVAKTLLEDEHEHGWPKNGETYWYLDNFGSVYGTEWSDDIYDQARYAQGNCYRSEADATQARDYGRVVTKLRRCDGAYVRFRYGEQNHFIKLINGATALDYSAIWTSNCPVYFTTETQANAVWNSLTPEEQEVFRNGEPEVW